MIAVARAGFAKAALAAAEKARIQVVHEAITDGKDQLRYVAGADA